MDNFEIRTPSRKDSLEIIKLINGLASFEHLKRPSKSAQKRLIRDIFVTKRLRVFVAYVAGKAVGYALYFFTYSSFLARPTLYLEDIFVSESSRRMNIGTSLFLRCAKEAARRNCGRMEWTVLTWNSKAMRFYERKIGARRLKEWYIYRLDGNGLKRLSKN